MTDLVDRDVTTPDQGVDGQPQPAADPVDPAPQLAVVPTRPAVASRRARRGKEPRKVTRYTLDLETQQHKYLRMFALDNDTEASKVMRTLLYLLEADETLRQRVRDELFAEDDEPGED